jgi:hypothetical protein
MVPIDSLARLKVKVCGPQVEWPYLSGVLQDSLCVSRLGMWDSS